MFSGCKSSWIRVTWLFTHFEKDRILIIGNAESAYLEEECDKEKRIEVLEALLSKQPPAVIFCRSLQPVEEFITIAKKIRSTVIEFR